MERGTYTNDDGQRRLVCFLDSVILPECCLQKRKLFLDNRHELSLSSHQVKKSLELKERDTYLGNTITIYQHALRQKFVLAPERFKAGNHHLVQVGDHLNGKGIRSWQKLNEN